jgi:hypothetical protein
LEVVAYAIAVLGLADVRHAVIGDEEVSLTLPGKQMLFMYRSVPKPGLPEPTGDEEVRASRCYLG